MKDGGEEAARVRLKKIRGGGLTVSEQGVHVITERKEKIMFNKKRGK